MIGGSQLLRIGVPPNIAKSFAEAFRAAGLPE